MIHYLILAHKNFKQVELLAKELKTNNSKVYIHWDGRLTDFPKIKWIEYIKNRIKCNRWGFSITKAYISWIKEIFEFMKDGDHLVVISWQCFPIKKTEIIEQYINNLWDISCVRYYKAPEKYMINWIDRYYFNDISIFKPLNNFLYNLIEKCWHKMNGTKSWIINIIIGKIVSFILPRRKYICENYEIYKSNAWFCFSYLHVKYMIDFLNTEKWKKYYHSFEYTHIADEIFFWTLLLNSPYKRQIKNDLLRFIKFEGKTSSPVILTVDNFDELKGSEKLFARKFDMSVDEAILKKIKNV